MEFQPVDGEKSPAVENATPRPSASRIAEAHGADPRPKANAPTPSPAVDSHAKEPRVADAHVGETRAKATPPAASPGPTRIAEAHAGGPHAKATPTPGPVADAHPAVARAADTHATEPHAKTTPAPVVETHAVASHVAEAHPTEPRAKVTPTPGPVAETRAPATRTAEAHPPVAPKATPSTPGPVVETHPTVPKVKIVPPTPSRVVETHPTPPANPRAPAVASRYPWKTSIVTTVFWIGEPAGGHNFTPNFSSSWDSNWSRTYGGYDNPNPEARRNFIPVNFTPRQNPFYCALPYNDVTRGTTKPEARIVIPWFKEAFCKEGQSVCRDRWVEIRSRSGRVAYAQWSDCGPFRTDHWQYVFGMEKPRPNLNQGAGLDVSPALRDFLGLQSTDVTDWKFVDAREVPRGPWSLYGENNIFARK